MGDGEAVKQSEREILNNRNIEVTERTAIIKSRLGQGIFREKLFTKYGKCIVTGVRVPQVLVASHIKPWAVRSNAERLNVNNGLLLSATYDKLFDCGLISFLPSGKMLVSRLIGKDNADKLALFSNRIYDIKPVPEMKRFFDYHNDVIFIS